MIKNVAKDMQAASFLSELLYVGSKRVYSDICALLTLIFNFTITSKY